MRGYYENEAGEIVMFGYSEGYCGDEPDANGEPEPFIDEPEIEVCVIINLPTWLEANEWI